MKLRYTDVTEFTISRKDIELPYTPGLAYQFATQEYLFVLHTKPAYYCKYNVWRAGSDFIVINSNQLNPLFTQSNIIEAIYDRLTHKPNGNFLIELVDKQIEFANQNILMTKGLNDFTPTRINPTHNYFAEDKYDNFDYPLKNYNSRNNMPSTPKHLRGGRADVVRPRSEKQSRNTMCRCGSGRKYKHCCYLKS